MPIWDVVRVLCISPALATPAPCYKCCSLLLLHHVSTFGLGGTSSKLHFRQKDVFFNECFQQPAIHQLAVSQLRTAISHGKKMCCLQEFPWRMTCIMYIYTWALYAYMQGAWFSHHVVEWDARESSMLLTLRKLSYCKRSSMVLQDIILTSNIGIITILSLWQGICAC